MLSFVLSNPTLADIGICVVSSERFCCVSMSRIWQQISPKKIRASGCRSSLNKTYQAYVHNIFSGVKPFLHLFTILCFPSLGHHLPKNIY